MLFIFSGTEKVLLNEGSLFSDTILMPSRSKVEQILKEINR